MLTRFEAIVLGYIALTLTTDYLEGDPGHAMAQEILRQTIELLNEAHAQAKEKKRWWWRTRANEKDGNPKQA